MKEQGHYSEKQLESLGIKSFGKNVKISKRSSIYSPERISIGNDVRIDDFCVLSGDIEIGSFIHLAPHVLLMGQAGIVVGDFSGFSSGVSIYSTSDDYWGNSLGTPMVPKKYKPGMTEGKIVFEGHNLVGSNSVVLPGVLVGEGSCIGALSLVKNSIESWGTYFGSPVKLIAKRNRNKILELKEEFLRELESKVAKDVIR